MVASQIPHDAGLAPIHTLAKIPWENFFPQGDSNQHTSYSMEPRHNALDNAAIMRDNVLVNLLFQQKYNVTYSLYEY